MSVLLEEMTWEEAREAAAADRAVIVPIGAIEQHGPHLPLGTDAFQVEGIARRAAERAGAVVGPALRCGLSANHADFVGTIVLEPSTFLALIGDVVASLALHGFRRILLLNGHGGNDAAVEVAGAQLRQRLPGLGIGWAHAVRLVDWRARASESGIVYHADEGETSLMLAVRPELVRTERARREMTDAFSSYYHTYYADDAPLRGLVSYGLPPTRELSGSGVMGDPTFASCEKGEQVLEESVATLVRVLRDLAARPVVTRNGTT